MDSEFNKFPAKILVVDDEEDTRIIFKRKLENEYYVETATSTAEAIKLLEAEEFHIAMTDLVMPDQDGIELLKMIKKRWPQIGVIVISGKASIEMAVEAMKNGAEDFIEKPVEDLELLHLMIEKILRLKWQTQEIDRLRRMLAQGFEHTNIVGNSPAIQNIIEKVRKVAPLDTTILITGDTGVGKELFAELIYRNSKRKDKKFVAVNCGSLPENLLESMLFGHKKGSFTSAVRDKIGYFQEADGGTLFLDEITETSTAFQVKLLRALEKGIIRWVGADRDIEIDVRIIAATNKNLEEEVKKGNFREDLYYRLNVINIHIPPLRDRIEDIRLLAKFFVSQFSEKYDKPGMQISDQVMSLLMTQEWKGNVRELRNVIEHAVAMASHKVLLTEDLPASILQTSQDKDLTRLSHLLHLDYPRAKDYFEKSYLEELLLKCNGDVTRAARISQIKRQNMYEKFKKHDIDPAQYRGD
ncbi:MAG: sigma-54-dependent Fis family transcriptional regulator [Candidatus Cloacimonetes bacterium]|nr:sigma-54-dependent Fis family transcriptional regulator [Candidatus Cloacimonadota bacterium]